MVVLFSDFVFGDCGRSTTTGSCCPRTNTQWAHRTCRNTLDQALDLSYIRELDLEC